MVSVPRRRGFLNRPSVLFYPGDEADQQDGMGKRQRFEADRC